MIRYLVPFSLCCFLSITVFVSCNSSSHEQQADERTAPLSVSGLSAPFNQSFKQVLNSYFELKEALVASDTVKANAAAASLQLNADNLKYDELKGDTSGMIRETAQTFSSTISGSANAITGEKTLDDKRREFNMISDALWNLTRTVRFDGEKLYYQYCPMAFDNTGGYWLSRNIEVRNPYLGEKMVSCGEVTDSLDYSKK